jgi:TRAP-type C4-dicarboxylate transport system substrate-binding protein
MRGVRLGLGAVLGAALVLAPVPAAAQRTLKFATLAPEGSAWMKLFREWDRAVQKRTNGRLRIKFLPGGVAGDERDMVRLMGLGRLDGAALTGNGVGLVQPEIRVLELPFLLRDDGELDHVRRHMAAAFRQKLAERGLVLLAWGDAGWIHLFANTPVASRDDLRRAKVWAWTDDPIARAIVNAFGITGVPLGVPDVLPGLASGQVDCVYGSPLSILSLGWYRKVKYMLEVPLGMSTGAMVVSKREFDALPADEQQALLEAGQAMELKLHRIVRADNQAALGHLRKAGIQFVRPAPGAAANLEAESQKVWRQLAGSVYSQATLEEVNRLLEQYRKR